jgi:hypothetical protein
MQEFATVRVTRLFDVRVAPLIKAMTLLSGKTYQLSIGRTSKVSLPGKESTVVIDFGLYRDNQPVFDREILFKLGCRIRSIDPDANFEVYVIPVAKWGSRVVPPSDTSESLYLPFSSTMGLVTPALNVAALTTTFLGRLNFGSSSDLFD